MSSSLPHSEPLVTVIMRTKNSAHIVDQALCSLAAQDFQDFELLVIDSGSTDDTLEIVGRFEHRLLTLAPEDYFPGPVLNSGAAAARGKILVFWNSDVVALRPDCLDNLLSPFDSPQVVASFARQLPRPEASTWVRRDYDASFPDSPHSPSWIPLSLPLAAMRRATWKIRPFYNDAWASEDSEWGHWALDQGLDISYCPEATVMHSHNYTLSQLFGRRYVEGEADAYILPTPPRRLDYFFRYVRSLGNDLLYHISHRRFGDIIWSPIGRAVFHAAHFRGRAHGHRRQLQRDPDRHKGQQVALKYHPSTGRS